MKTFRITLDITTPDNVQLEDVQSRIDDLIAVGLADAQATHDDEDLDSPEAAMVLAFDISKAGGQQTHASTPPSS